MKKAFLGIVLATVLYVHDASAQHQHPVSAYADETGRAIKALAPEDVEGYLEGTGMGLARAAELNGYPGPLHVLELEAPLELTPEQRQAATDLLERVRSEAAQLGRRIVEQEQALDALFRGGTADEAGVTALTAGIATLQGALRGVHLNAHIEMITHLSEAQVARYNALRGYADASGAGPGAHEGHH